MRLTGISFDVTERKRAEQESRERLEFETLIADLSSFYHLEPGDLIYTGTPEGVGPVLAGDRIEGRIEGVGEISLLIGPAE